MLLIIATHPLQQNEPPSTQLILAVLCVIVLSSVALAVCVGLVRRMQQIADTTPRKHSPPPSTPPDDQSPT